MAGEGGGGGLREGGEFSLLSEETKTRRYNNQIIMEEINIQTNNYTSMGQNNHYRHLTMSWNS